MWQWIISAAAGFLAGTSGAMGLGGGSILLLCLTLFDSTEQLRAQGINLIFFIPCAVIALWLHHRDGRIKWRVVFPAAICGIIGTVAGYFLSGFLGNELLGKTFGVFLLILGAKELFSPHTVSSAHGVDKKSDVGRIDSK